MVHWLDIRTSVWLLCHYQQYVFSSYLKCKGLFVYTAWEQFRDFIPENERDCFVTAYHKRLNSEDLETQVSVMLWFYSFIESLKKLLKQFIERRDTVNMCLITVCRADAVCARVCICARVCLCVCMYVFMFNFFVYCKW